MKLKQVVKPELSPFAYEKVSLQAARKSLEDPRPVYKKNWELVRLPRPAEALADTTRAWLLELPVAVRPVELVQRYPRIANRLARLWPHPDQWERYTTDLLIVRRGDSIRQGFPVQVARELTALRQFFASLHAAAFEVPELEWK